MPQTDGIPQAHAIIGPTGVGKSAVAVALAREFTAPIVVADRIQCYLDLPITSARDDVGAGEGLQALTRLHLSQRSVADGDYPPEQAMRDLRMRLDELAEQHPFIVIEGGSISLLRLLAGCGEELGYRLTAHTVHIVDRRQYRSRLRDRAYQMLRADAPATGMLGELAAAWRHTEQRAFVASINGFEAVLEWCDDRGVDPLTLSTRSFTHAELDEIADLIAHWHVEHGYEQEQVFSRLFTDVPTAAGS
ncbi:isopentenyl transferase family protein [Micromonospora sp. KC606]|uniref:isopentenyl transferase family protein n=1 Tax=Micromonospora sp. KC606 TaxID=2530379 RepID=UPI001A9EB091|nr:isopentenyl transferase family protein [Micromonospora sp. KC606]